MTTLPCNQSAERNKEHIIPILEGLLGKSGHVLEVASGTGQHGHLFASRNPDVFWQPTDITEENISSINAWRKNLRQENFLPPMLFDCAQTPPSLADQPYDLMVNINMIHISPWATSEGLITAASRLLKPKGYLYLYGPYTQKNVETVESNLNFDRWLRDQNPDFGLRALEDITELAKQGRLDLERVIPMTANNLSVIFQKR